MITLPTWVEDGDFYSREYKTDEDCMSLAVELSAMNVSKGTGGPFGCAIFEKDTETGERRLFSMGMNRVVTLSNSALHGEMVAIQFAQMKLGAFSLNNATSGKTYEMFTSCEPCAMCLGGTLWSGVSRIVCGATKADAMSIGFDEGPVTEESYLHLERAGVQVKKKVLHEEAAKVLQDYGKSGVVYNR